MPNEHNFEHLPLVLRSVGPARLRGGGTQSAQTKANRVERVTHSATLSVSSRSLSTNWRARREARQTENLPVLPQDIPILVQIDPNLPLEVLREKFSFEIVAEQEEGYVIVASEDIDLAAFQAMVNDFATRVWGSGTIASVHRLFDDPAQSERLDRILSDELRSDWANVGDETVYIVDTGIACTGTKEIPPLRKRGKRDTDADWARKATGMVHGAC